MENRPTAKGRFWWLFCNQKKWYLQGIQLPQVTDSGLINDSDQQLNNII